MKTKILCIGSAALLISGAAVLMIPVSEEPRAVPKGKVTPVKRMDLTGYSAESLAAPVDLLFIHHSCGGQMLAPEGSDVGTNCIYASHPNGGDLRTALERNGYRVHEASYGCRIGQNTDIFDWLPKFRTQMQEILTCDSQDALYSDGRRNRVVMFKSCFPNSDFKAQGVAPGRAAGPELTVWNARAAYTALLDEFRNQPDTLFVCLTAPPLAPRGAPQPLWKALAKKALGRNPNNLAESGRLAREFNNWLSAEDGWLANSGLTNVVVFDYYDVLTDHGASDLSCYATGDGMDSHPSSVGNRKAAEALVPLLNRACRRAGVAP